MRLYQIDAFTQEAFRGNPAAVCLLDAERDAAWMQNVAAEMNLSETAFLLPRGDEWSLRWFTPAVEVALCGHATLASAHALYEERGLTAARFQTLGGLLTTERSGDWIEMDFPAKPTTASDPPAGLLESLGVRDALYVGRNQFDYVVEVANEEEVRALQPDHARLRTIPVRGAIVTSRGREHDFVSRFFGPAVGVDEDPVTGSAHCALTPYWAAKLGKDAMTAYQASKRGGIVRVRLAGDRVKLGGQAVTVLRGELV
ncbi:MAG TPA: PhzF family phenazine biosynthesis protein [Thermoanaerobaculia bacterium]|jgi:PhzF family phenazine biosynthesis protein|nr:PhzF family phenazine biosynthesis protein [Thermoanaerobaculia bacterium]